jgi:CHAT domain
MPLSAGDVSEYVAPRGSDVARLTVDLDAADRKSGRHPARAWVDDGPVMTGQFIANPDWAQTAEYVRQTSSSYTGDSGNTTIGTQLFGALFSGALSRCWAQAVERARQRHGLHIVIRSSDLTAQSMPWELLYDPVGASGQVALTEGWSVIREYPTPPDVATPIATQVHTSDLRILVLTSHSAAVSQDNDPKLIADAFSGAHIRSVADVQTSQLVTELADSDAQLVHVLGTGVRARQGRQQLLVGLPSGAVAISGTNLVDALVKNDRKALRLLVLAACDSDLLAAELAAIVPNVIGIRGKISDDGCLAFLRGLYGALASGSTIDQAVASGRAQQLGFSQSLGDEWAQPVLFLTDGSPLVQRASTTGAESIRTREHRQRTGPPAAQSDRLLLDMKESNLRALRKQWEQVDTDDTPQFVSDQIAALDRDVRLLANKVRGPTR